MSSVQLKALTKRFGRQEVIRGVDLALPDGVLTVFVGPSGCGKSTLLRLIAGLEDPTSGQVFIGERDVTDLPPAQRGIAMVFQSYALYPHMSVFDNMAFGLKLAGGKRAEREQQVRTAARSLQIEELLDKRPRELSGGQRQRVAIGRAIVRQPDVFLFDEPLSNLDAALRVQMRQELGDLQRRLGTTMIYVTHDQVEAMTLGERIVVLNAGRVEQVGSPLALYRRPVNRFVAGFIGSPQMNFIDAHVAAISGDGFWVQMAENERLRFPRHIAGLDANQPVVVGIRPEHLAPAAEGIKGTLKRIERLGSETYLHVTTAGGQLTVRAPGDTALQAGDPVSLGASAENLHLFTAEGMALYPG
jgi:multiple sugar transport system ATP-binding protein